MVHFHHPKLSQELAGWEPLLTNAAKHDSGAIPFRDLSHTRGRKERCAPGVGGKGGGPIYKRDGIDLWSTITNFQIIRRAAWLEADRSAEISKENL